MSQQKQLTIGAIFMVAMEAFLVGLVLLMNRTLDNRRPEAQTVGSGENYIIKQVSNPGGETNVEVQLRAPKGFPYGAEGFEAYPVIQDTTGTWQLLDFSGDPKFLSVSTRGFYILDLTDVYEIPDNWILVQTAWSPGQRLSGWWGNTSIATGEKNLYGDWYLHGLVFPIRKGYTTRVILTVGKLEIVVLNAEGSQALPARPVTLFCQGEDLAGNIIPDRSCGGDIIVGAYWRKTDVNGLATFYVGPHTYSIRVYEGTYGAKDFFLYDITMSTGEKKRVVVKYQP